MEQLGKMLWALAIDRRWCPRQADELLGLVKAFGNCIRKNGNAAFPR